MPGQRARPAIPADHRSAHPNIPGLPWWGAVLTAVVASTLGFAFDAGSGGKELTGAFSALYVLGCVAAVLAVRQAGVFTAVIQPPLILFVIVPGAYYLMHSADIHGVKDILINCGYPLIERFPLMFFTSAAVLLLGLARWYLGGAGRQTAPAAGASHASDTERATGGGLSAKLSSLLGGRPDSDAPTPEPRRRSSLDRRSGASKPPPDRSARAARPARRAGATSRSRHARPPDTEIIEPVVDVDRPRRRRPRPSEPPPAAEPRRRARNSSGREPRVPPSERRATRDRAERGERSPRPQRRTRYEGWPGSPERDGWSGDPERDGYEPLEPHRPAGNGSHHPISRVRYRGGDESEDRTEYRTRRRAPRDYDADRWEYDI